MVSTMEANQIGPTGIPLSDSSTGCRDRVGRTSFSSPADTSTSIWTRSDNDNDSSGRVSPLLLRDRFRRGEHGFVVPDLLRDQRIELLVHGRQQGFVVSGMGRVGQVVHLFGIRVQVVEGDIVVGQKLLDRCRQVVVAHPEVADQLVTAVEDAAEQLAGLRVRRTDLVDEALELLHAAMELLSGGGGGGVEHLGRVADEPFRVDGGDHVVGDQASLSKTKLEPVPPTEHYKTLPIAKDGKEGTSFSVN